MSAPLPPHDVVPAANSNSDTEDTGFPSSAAPLEDADAPTPPAPAPRAADAARRSAWVLLLFALAFTALLATVHALTRDRIDSAAAAARLRLIDEVLPATAYDNALLDHAIPLPATAELGLRQPGQAYRATRGGQAVGVVLPVIADDGYAGRIELIVAILADGRVAGVRVTRHQETPGLGDYIDPRKDRDKRHPWIDQFTGRGLDDHLAQGGHGGTPPTVWAVRRDGGDFDARSGATISARAVTEAVGRALRYARAHHPRLFAPTERPS